MAKRALCRNFLFIASATAILILPLTYLVTGQPGSATEDPKQIVKDYLQAVYARDYPKAYQWISAEDRKNKSKADYLRENPSFSGSALGLTRQLAQMIDFQNLQSEIRDNQATVRFKVRLPNAGDASLQELFLDFDEERLTRLTSQEIQVIEQKLESMRKQGTLPMIEGEDSVELVREQGQWRVFANWAGAIRVHFKAEVKENLPWEFRSVQETVLAKPGETLQAIYRAKNLSDKTVTAKALHIDTPKELTEKYLQIIQCFCFIQETLKPGEEKELSLIFRVNWDVPKSVKEFNVTYEFYPIDKFPAT